MLPRYRAWDLKRKMMFPVQSIHWSADQTEILRIIIWLDVGSCSTDDYAFQKVSNLILLQSTGIKEKIIAHNPREIFADDICRYRDHSYKLQVGVVEWSNGWNLIAIGGDDEGNQDIDLGDTDYREIIGTIHQNPELLEGKA